MKKYSLFIACTIVTGLGILAYAFEFNVLTGSLPNQKVATENDSAASNQTLTSNLDSIPNYIEPAVIESTLNAAQKKQYSKLNETQQKEALSAIGHQKGVKDMVTYGEIELDRLKESDKEIAQKDMRAEEIIQALKAKVGSTRDDSKDLEPK